MTAQIIVLSDYRKAKTEPKLPSFDEFWQTFIDPFGLFEEFARRNRTEGDER